MRHRVLRGIAAVAVLATCAGVLGAGVAAGAGYPTPAPMPLRPVEYVVGPGETLSQILYAHGIGTPDSDLRLYTRDGWVLRMLALNGLPESTTSLTPGSRLRLLVPMRKGARDAEATDAMATPSGRQSVRWWLLTVPNLQSLRTVLLLNGRKPEWLRTAGTDGWEARIRRLNPAIGDRDPLPAGTRILVFFPDKGGPADRPAPPPAGPRPSPAIPPAAPVAAKPPPPPLDEKQAKVMDRPAEHTLEEIVDLPPEHLERIPPKVIGEKLTDERIANLRAEEAEKIPETVKEDKAWDFSLLDLFKPGAKTLFSGMSATTASGYIGLRVGIPYTNDPGSLFARARIIGLLAEMRGSVLKGLRFYWDSMPRVSAEVKDTEVRAQWSRQVFGWAFEFNMPWLVDKAHLTPKVGRYTIAAKLPVAETAEGTLITRDLSIDNGLSLGLEADLELAAFFYILRAWAAADVSGAALGIDRDESVTSRRFGVDAFLKGGGFTLAGLRLSPSYLLFIANEVLDLTGTQADTGVYTIHMNIPYGGGGVSLSW